MIKRLQLISIIKNINNSVIPYTCAVIDDMGNQLDESISNPVRSR